MDLDLREEVVKRFIPFLDELVSGFEEKLHSVHITGSALTEDFDPGMSDINSICVLRHMDLTLLELLASLGKRYGKKRVSAPLIMTPDYIKHSLDVFPLEFLNIKILHRTVFGTDLFKDLEIGKSDLRQQCERELKVRLIGLRQGYISSAGDRKILNHIFINTLSGYISLFRGILVLLGAAPPILNQEVLTALEKAAGVSTGVFLTVLRGKKERTRLTIQQLNAVFKDYYAATEKLGEMIDEIGA